MPENDEQFALVKLLSDLQQANLNYVCAHTAVLEYLDARITKLYKMEGMAALLDQSKSPYLM